MIDMNKIEKTFISFFKAHSELSYFLISSILLSCRLFLSFEYFSDIHYVIVIFLLGQVTLMIFMKKIKKIISERFFFLNMISMEIHFLSIYLVSQKNFDFFLGIEASLILHLNFKRIDNKIMRYLSLSFLMFFYIKKHDIVQTDFLDIIYFIFILFLFENLLKSRPIENINTKTSEISEAKRMTSSSSKKIARMNSPSKAQKSPLKNSIQNPFLKKESVAVNIMDIINVGILVISPDFEIIYANNSLFEFFATKNLEEIKEILFQTEENKNINNSDFDKIPDFSLQKLFKKVMHIPESLDSYKIDQISENHEQRKNFLNESFTLKSRQSPNLSMSQDECDIQFRKWKKRRLSDNLSEMFFGMENNNTPKPNTFLNYLNRLLNYCKDTGDVISDESQIISISQKDIEKYSMYASLKLPNNSETSVLINFIPLKKGELENDIMSSNHEIMITMRKLSEVEMKHKNDNCSKNKILGTFCHELRTPINGLINMLDLMQSHLEDEKFLSENTDAIFNEFLSSAVISSHLLLNQIDDFIDYFAYSNEMLELNIGAFDIHAFFNEIFRVFSHVAIKKNLNLFIDMDDNIPTVVFNDHKKLKQILFNLLNNSIRYTDSGFIKISAKLRSTNYIEITVIDTGAGIKTLEMDSLGRINKNAEDISKATCGFGLFISNILCHLIDNSSSSQQKKGLVAYSEYGKGTCFSFILSLEKNQQINNQRISYSSISIDKKEQKIFSISSLVEIDRKPIHAYPPKHRLSMNSSLGIEGAEKPRLSINSNLKPLASYNSNEEIISTRSILTKKLNLERNIGKAKFLKSSSNSVSNSYNSSSGFRYFCECPKVMIVDDVPFNVEVCRKLLLKHKIISEVAYNGLEAVIKVETFLKNLNERKFCDECRFYKLILMDVDMPLKNGIEATKEILNLMKNTGFSVDIVGLSAFHQEEIKQRGREAGMSEYILKPINSNKMKDLIIKYILGNNALIQSNYL